jgi:hypothetical protein
MNKGFAFIILGWISMFFGLFSQDLVCVIVYGVFEVLCILQGIHLLRKPGGDNE